MLKKYALFILLTALLTGCATEKKKYKPSQGSADYHIDQARRYEQNGQVDDAIKEYSAAINKSPHNWVSFHGRAIAWAKKGSRKQSMADFDAIDEIRQKDKACSAPAYYVMTERGRAIALLGDYEAALYLYNQVDQRWPKIDSVRADRAKIHLALGRYPEALTDLDSVGDNRNRHHRYFYLRSLAHQGMGILHEAISDVQRAVDASGFPTKKDYLNRLGYLQEKAVEQESEKSGAESVRSLISIYELAVLPRNACAQENLTLTIEYGLFDEFNVFDTLPLTFSNTIKKGDRVLFSSTPVTDLVPKNTSIKRRIHLQAGKIPGEYTIEVTVRHQHVEKVKSTIFSIN